MTDTTTPEARSPQYPEGKVIGAVEPAAVDAVRESLISAGFAADQIDVVTAADVEDLDVPPDRSLMSRFLTSVSYQHQELERMRQELRGGHVLVAVPVEGDDAMHRVRGILLANGGHEIQYFGRWTITTLG